MREAIWLPNGNIEAPVAVEQVLPDGEVVQADGRAEVLRGSDLWRAWLPFVADDPPPAISEATRPHSMKDRAG